MPPSVDATGNLTFTPAPDQVGLVFVTVRAKDDGGLEDWGVTGQTQPDDTSDDVTFQLVVMPDAVTAVDDTPTIAEDQLPSPVTIDVLGNDTFPAGATITGVTQGTLGTVTIAPDGLSLALRARTPNANGSDTSPTRSTTAPVRSTRRRSISLSRRSNDVPVVGDDSLNVGRNAPATAVDVLANDHDVDTTDTLTIIAKTDGLKGTVVITGGGTGLTYQPGTDETGADSFTYTASDGHGGDVVGNVSVVIADGALPVANDDTATMLEDAAATAIPVLGNDTDADVTDVLTITGKTNGAKGVVALTSATDADLQAEPQRQWLGQLHVLDLRRPRWLGDGHRQRDHHPGQRQAERRSMTRPHRAGERRRRGPSRSSPTTSSSTATRSHHRQDQGAHGTVAITGGGTGLTYDPNQLYVGTDGFTYTVSDGHGQTATATVLLTVVKDTVKPVTTAPVQTFYNQTSGTSSVKVKVAWGGSDTGGTGVASYKLQVSVNGHAYTTITSSTTATSTTRTLSINSTYRFRVRATDKQGNVGFYAYGPTFKPVRYQNTSSAVHYVGPWTTSSNASALGGSHRYTSTSGRRSRSPDRCATSPGWRPRPRPAGRPRSGSTASLVGHDQPARLHDRSTSSSSTTATSGPSGRTRSRSARSAAAASTSTPSPSSGDRPPSVRGHRPLLYCRGRIRSPMIEPGRGWGYLVLFSEIGISLLVTTLVGALVGHWVDGQLGMTFPVFMLIGFFLGAGAGTLMIIRLVSRFLKSFD